MNMLDVDATAKRMLQRYGKDAHMHASYNYMNNHGKNQRAEEFWRAVADKIKSLKLPAGP